MDGETRGETPVAVGSSGGNEPDTEETFDPNRTSHVGQYALRRLYRESTRSALVVLYTADGMRAVRAVTTHHSAGGG